jgi:GMP synthase PP-ATPase subunit
MKAADYYGPRDVRVETVPKPSPGPGFVMRRVGEQLREFDEVLHEAFKVIRSITTIVAVLSVEVLGILKLWALLAGR